MTWLSKAATQGHRQAQLFLGVIYLTGRGVDQDPVSGYAQVHISAENGAEAAVQLRERLRQEMESAQLEQAQLEQAQLEQARQLSQELLGARQSDQ